MILKGNLLSEQKEKSANFSNKFIRTVQAWKSKLLRESDDQSQVDLDLVELESDIRSDVMRGPIPIAMTRHVIEGAMFYGADSPIAKRKGKGQGQVLISCHRCGDTKAERYMALDIENKSRILLECIDCLVEVAKEENVSKDDVSEFVDNRYLGACEACSYMQGA